MQFLSQFATRAPPIMQGSPPAHGAADARLGPGRRGTAGRSSTSARFLPTVEVWRGNGHRRRLDARRASISTGLPVDDSEGGPTTLAGLLDETYTDGFLVLKDGAIAYERYFNGMTRAHAASVAVDGEIGHRLRCSAFWPGAACRSGAAGDDYLPELGATGWAGASVQHVLDMTTGVRFSEEYTDPLFGHRPGRCRLGLEAGSARQRSGLPLAVAYVRTDPGARRSTSRPHGAAFEYRSIETDVLAFIMERVTGKRLAATGVGRALAKDRRRGKRLLHRRQRRLCAGRWRLQRDAARLWPLRPD